MKTTKGIKIAIFAMVGLLAACAAPRENAILQEAQQSYTEARNNPQVMSYAPLELNAAGESLQEAERLMEQDAEDEIVTHQAYLALQKTKIARQRAELELAQKAIDEADSQRKEVLLESRNRELQEAMQTAEARKKRLEEAQLTEEQRAEELKSLQQQREEELQRLRSELKDLQSAKQTERGIVLTLGDVLFDFNEAELKPGAQRTIQTLSNFLQEYPERKVMIEGFTDSVGPEDYNQKLSEQRAGSVRDALVSMGISQDRIQTKGYGENYPVASNDTTAGRQLNRRVEIVISSGTETISTREAEGSQ